MNKVMFSTYVPVKAATKGGLPITLSSSLKYVQIK